MIAALDISETELNELGEVLAAMGLRGPGGDFKASRLAGGVSCDVWRIDLPERSIVLKRALPRLRVEADWHAPPKRAETETDWFAFAASLNPNWVPEILGEDRKRHMFAMEYLPEQTHPLWKAELAAGRADVGFAAHVGEALARIHAASASRDDVAHDFDHPAQFQALRLEPYLFHAAEKHHDVAPRIRALAKGVAEARIALMQGDISPKNILIGPEGPVFLDAETACYGDPAFDLAFCLNHLLLKCVWYPEHRGAYLASYAALKNTYLDNVTWEESDAISERAAALLGALLLARVDGKSPVEYLTDDADKAFVRKTAKALLTQRGLLLDDVMEQWARSLPSP